MHHYIGIFSIISILAVSQTAIPEDASKQHPAFWPEYDVPEIEGEIQDWFDLGMSLYKIGNYTEALALFEKIQNSAAHHSPSLIYRNACVLKLNKEIINEGGRRIALGLVEFPGVKLENASLEELFDYLQRRVAEITKNEFSINIIFNGPQHLRSEQKLSFELKQGPLETLLLYVAQLSNCRAQVDEHAIVITPSGF